MNILHPPICGFFISRKSVQKSSFVHKSGESPQIESVGDFIHTTYALVLGHKIFQKIPIVPYKFTLSLKFW